MTAQDTLSAQSAVLFCSRCVPSSAGTLPMDVHLLGVRTRVAFVVPEPPIEDIRIGRVFQSNGGHLLRALIEDRFEKRDYAVVPVQGCRGSTARCRDHLERQLMSMDRLEGVVLVGGEAKDAWRPDITLKQSQGLCGRMLDRWWCVPIINPDSVKKGYEFKPELKAQLDTVKALLDGDFEPDFVGMYDCPVKRCGFEGKVRDPDGVWYCAKHWSKYGGQWKKVRKQWDEDKTEWQKIKLPGFE